MWIWEGRIGGQQRDLRGKALPVGGKRLQTRRGVEPLLPGLGAGHPSCGGNRDLADPFRELHWEEARSAWCLLGAVQPPHMCEDSSRFSRGNPRPGPASPPCPEGSRPPQEQPAQGSPGHGLGEFMGTQTSAPNPPSCRLWEAAISVLSTSASLTLVTPFVTGRQLSSLWP